MKMNNRFGRVLAVLGALGAVFCFTVLPRLDAGCHVNFKSYNDGLKIGFVQSDGSVPSEAMESYYVMTPKQLSTADFNHATNSLWVAVPEGKPLVIAGPRECLRVNVYKIQFSGPLSGSQKMKVIKDAFQDRRI